MLLIALAIVLVASAAGAFDVVLNAQGEFLDAYLIDLGSVVIPARIDEYDLAGAFVRTIVADGVPANPLGIDVGGDGTLYYAELNLDPQTFSPRCGRVSRVRIASGAPLAPEVLGTRLRFPDGVTVVDSSALKVRVEKLPDAVAIDPSRCGGE